MEQQSHIERIQSMVTTLVQGSSLFLIDIKIKPTNNIKVFLDGDEGVTIDAVSKLNRALYKQIEEAGMYPDGDFSLEVSSAGVDEPLKLFRQYKKNIGRTIAVTLQDDIVKTGKLLSADEDKIVIEETIGKKKEKITTEIPFNNINKTVVQVVF